MKFAVFRNGMRLERVAEATGALASTRTERHEGPAGLVRSLADLHSYVLTLESPYTLLLDDSDSLYYYISPLDY